MARKIDFQLGFTVDKAQLTELQQVLKQIQKDAESATGTGSIATQLSKASVEAEKLERILNQSWNGKLNQLDVSKFTDQIKKGYGSVEQLKKSFESVGRGDVFNKVQASVAGANLQLKQSNKLLDSMAQTMSNTVRFGLASSVFNRLSDGLQSAYNYSIKLNSSLNDIRIVSDKSAEDMERFAAQANEAAKALGASTLDYTKASTIYYQQGLGDKETAARTETTIKAANVTGQTGDEVSEQLTAIWNGYKVSAEESEMYIDKVAKVAAATAADLEELSTGMSKTASAANAMGVDFDNLNAMLATVISVTREAPETIGTSFRSIFSRMSQLDADGTDEFGVTLSEVTAKMKAMGVEILDQNGELKDMDDILSDVASKWNDWSRGQQVAAARVMAGTQQYSRFIALMDNQDMWNQALENSKNSLGELDRENNIYLESTKAHLQQLSTEAEKTYNLIFDQDVVTGFTDSLTGALSVFNNFLETTGGGMTSLLTLGNMLGNLFNKQIGAGISKSLQNIQVGSQNEQNLLEAQSWTDIEASKQGVTKGEIEVYEQIREKTQEILGLSKGLTTEQYNQLNTLREQALADNLLKAQLDEQKDKFTDMNQINADLKLQNQKIKEQKDGYEKIRKAIQENNILREASTIYEEERETALDNQRIVLDEIEKLAKQGLISSEQGAVYEEALERDNKNRLLTKQQLQKLDETANDALAKQIEREKELTKEKQLQQMLDEGKDVDVDRNAKQSNQELEKGISTAKNTQDIQSAVNGMTTLVTLISSAVGLIRTLNDDSLSGWEKFERIISTLIITLPTFISGAKDLALLPSTLGAVKAQLDATTISVLGLKLSMWELTLIIAAVVAVIGAIVYIGQQLYNVYTADARAAEQAAETAKELEENYTSLSEAAKELKENITGYEEAKKDLEDLTKGTDEYAEALETANEKAKELIESLGLYNDYTIKDGIIEIDLEALKKAQLDANNRANKAEEEMNFARLRSNEARMKSNRTDFSREVGTTIKRERMINGSYYDKTIALSDEALKTIINNISADSKAITDLETGNTEAIKNFINNIDGLSDESKLLTDKIVEESDSLKELVQSTKEAAEANKYYIEQMNASAIKEQFNTQLNQMATRNGTKAFDEARYNQVIDIINKGQTQEKVRNQKEASSKKIAENIDQDYLSHEFLDVNKNDFVNDIINDTWGIGTGVIGGNINDDEDLARKYAKYVKNMSEDKLNKLIFKKGKLQDETGQTVIDASNGEQRGKMRAGILSTVISDYNNDVIEQNNQSETLDFIDNLNQATANAATLGAKYGTDFSDALLNAISSETKSFDLSSVYARLDPNEVAELRGVSNDPQALAKMFGLSEENIKQLGFESSQQFADNFKAGLEKYKWDIDSAISASMDKKSADLEEAGEGLSKKKLQQYEQDVQIYAKNLMQIAESSDEVADGLKYDSDLAVDFALRVIKMNKAIDNLADSYEDWSDIIKKSSKTSQEYAEAMYGMRDALADVYDTSMDYISNDFIAEHLFEIEKIATGDEKAIEGLRDALSQEIVANIIVENNIENKDAILAEFQDLRSQIEGQLSSLEIGAPVVDDGDLVTSLNKMIEDCQMTVEQANAVFSALGVEPTYETETVTQPQSNPIIETTTYTEETDGKDLEYVGPDGQKHVAKVPNFKQIQTSKTVGYTKDNVEVPVTAIAMNGKQPKISGIKKAPGGSMNNYSSKNKGGKSPGSSSKKGRWRK